MIKASYEKLSFLTRIPLLSSRRRRLRPVWQDLSRRSSASTTTLSPAAATTTSALGVPRSLSTTQQHAPPEEAIRSLLETFVASQMLVPPVKLRGPQPANNGILFHDHWLKVFADMGDLGQDLEVGDEEQEASLVAQDDTQLEPRVQMDLEDAVEQRRRADTRRIEKDFAICIRRRDAPRAVHVYQAALRLGLEEEVRPQTYKALAVLLASRKQSLEAFRFFQHYRNGDPTTDINLLTNIYRRLCDSIRHLDPHRHEMQLIESMVRTLVGDVQRLNKEGKKICYPVLVSALVEQKAVGVGKFAGLVYKNMMREKIPVKKGYLEHLLSHSKFYRQGDLPYADLLRQASESGRLPDAGVALNVVENFFPYKTCVEETYVALEALVNLQRAALPKSGRKYPIDISTLEAISSVAASRGLVEMNMLVWDMVDMLGYAPTEGLYENTVLVFLRPETYGRALAVLVDLCRVGDFTPSRAFVRSLSTHLREPSADLSFFLDRIEDLCQREEPTTWLLTALNAVLSACAERTDVRRALTVLDEFESTGGIKPNADSFGFALEAVGKHLARSKKSATRSDKDTALERADTLLSYMEKLQIAPTQHVIRDYVELLCCADQVETATQVVLEAVQEAGLASNKTIYRVALANAENEQFDMARRLGSLVSVPMPFLDEKIENIEKSRRAQDM